MITKNRKAGSRGVAHGGVAVAYRAAAITMKEIKLANPRNFEVLATASTLEGRSRKLICIACYIPPGYDVRRGRDCLSYISEAVMEIKRRYREPYIVVSGDFNQWDITSQLEDFTDIIEVAVGDTRGTASIDRIFTNFNSRVLSCGTVAPLDVDDGDEGAPSDHRVAFVKSDLERFEAFEWIKYSYMYYNDDSVREFGSWIRGYDWSRVTSEQGSNNKANVYQDIIGQALRSAFPTITTRRKSTELPWINGRIRRLIRRRRACLLYTSPSPRDS